MTRTPREMCGIAGFHGWPAASESRREVLRQMVARLSHRGPDDQGEFLDDQSGLGHARLSIVDLATGRQPMTNAAAATWITFNGEIFNYVELHAALAQRGHSFRTTSDTEVILHQYEVDGPTCVASFNGDFAFALWDQRRQRLLLARDRLGVRPLYYTWFAGGLFFASEIKAFLAIPGFRAELDPIGLDQTFTFWSPVAPRTAFKDVLELPPAHLAVLENGRLNVHPYWRLEYPPGGHDPEFATRGLDSLADELRSLLADATRLRLRADVPVGAYLSGGLDSAIVTALIQQGAADRLRTFSVGFAEEEFDETVHQRAVVEHLRVDHASVRCDAASIGRDFRQVVWHAEKPLLRTAPAPLFELAQLTRASGFKVVLTGEGADEIFAGYDLFKEAKLRRFWSRQPDSTRRPRLLRRLYPYLSEVQRQPQSYLEAFFRPGLEQPDDPFFSHRPRWRLTAQLKSFYGEGLRQALGDYDAIEDLRGQLPEAFAAWHPQARAQYLETAILLPGYLLSSQGDRVGMAHAVEGRYPFLDHRVVEFACRLPPRTNLRFLEEKYLLRRSMARMLPPGVLARHKQPYRAPDGASLLAVPDYVEECLAPEALARTSVFDGEAVNRLARKFRQGEVRSFRDNMALVGIVSVQTLCERFREESRSPWSATTRPRARPEERLEEQ